MSATSAFNLKLCLSLFAALVKHYFLRKLLPLHKNAGSVETFCRFEVRRRRCIQSSCHPTNSGCHNHLTPANFSPHSPSLWCKRIKPACFIAAPMGEPFNWRNLQWNNPSILTDLANNQKKLSQSTQLKCVIYYVERHLLQYPLWGRNIDSRNQAKQLWFFRNLGTNQFKSLG